MIIASYVSFKTSAEKSVHAQRHGAVSRQVLRFHNRPGMLSLEPKKVSGCIVAFAEKCWPVPYMDVSIDFYSVARPRSLS